MPKKPLLIAIVLFSLLSCELEEGYKEFDLSWGLPNSKDSDLYKFFIPKKMRTLNLEEDERFAFYIGQSPKDLPFEKIGTDGLNEVRVIVSRVDSEWGRLADNILNEIKNEPNDKKCPFTYKYIGKVGEFDKYQHNRSTDTYYLKKDKNGSNIVIYENGFWENGFIAYRRLNDQIELSYAYSKNISVEQWSILDKYILDLTHSFQPAYNKALSRTLLIDKPEKPKQVKNPYDGGFNPKALLKEIPQDHTEIDFSRSVPNSEGIDLYKFRIPEKFYPEYVNNEVDKYFIFHVEDPVAGVAILTSKFKELKVKVRIVGIKYSIAHAGIVLKRIEEASRDKNSHIQNIGKIGGFDKYGSSFCSDASYNYIKKDENGFPIVIEESGKSSFVYTAYRPLNEHIEIEYMFSKKVSIEQWDILDKQVLDIIRSFQPPYKAAGSLTDEQ